MSTLIRDFEAGYLAYNNISTARRRSYRAVLTDYEKAAGRALRHTDHNDFKQWLGKLIDDGFHPNTVRKKAAMVRCFYGWAFDEGIVGGDVYARVSRVRDPRGASSQSEPKPYTEAEVKQFWQDFDARYPVDGDALKHYLKRRGRFTLTVSNTLMHAQVEAIVGLALFVGMRRNEIFFSALDDIHYDNSYVAVLNGARKNRAGVVQTRQLPMIAPLEQSLKTWLDLRAALHPNHERPWLSLTPFGPRSAEVWRQPMRHEAFEMLMGGIGSGYELHRFRHTCATVWLKQGMPIDRLRLLLGHAKIQQTLAYARLDGTDLTKHMDKLGHDFATAVGR